MKSSTSSSVLTHNRKYYQLLAIFHLLCLNVNPQLSKPSAFSSKPNRALAFQRTIFPRKRNRLHFIFLNAINFSEFLRKSMQILIFFIFVFYSSASLNFEFYFVSFLEFNFGPSKFSTNDFPHGHEGVAYPWISFVFILYAIVLFKNP